MKTWQEDLLSVTNCEDNEHIVFAHIETAARSLGFDHCAYGLRVPLPISSPKTIILNNYCTAWQERYASQNYLQIDPTVSYGRRSQIPLVWSDEVFASTPALWDEAQSFGLKVGWSQSSLDAVGVGGMLTLSRARQSLSSAELSTQEVKMRWLVNIAHLTLARIFTSRLREQAPPTLTEREREVLRWTADGKTSSEVSDILLVSENTVNFHVKNAVAKLQTANKTAAVVRAAMLGLLN
jgi:LuxR family quorum-sensing system transcriptional regulator SolR